MGAIWSFTWLIFCAAFAAFDLYELAEGGGLLFAVTAAIQLCCAAVFFFLLLREVR